MTVFDLDLNQIASTTLGGCPRVNVSPHTGRVYVVDEVPNEFGVNERLTALDANGALRNSRIIGRYTRPVCYAVALVTAPGPPRDVRATVTGPDVTVSWTNVGAASAFVLDVGLAPGRTDASLFLGPDSSTTFTGMPPGTYYLRLRGGNEAGGGRASEDLRVVVPWIPSADACVRVLPWCTCSQGRTPAPTPWQLGPFTRWRLPRDPDFARRPDESRCARASGRSARLG